MDGERGEESYAIDDKGDGEEEKHDFAWIDEEVRVEGSALREATRGERVRGDAELGGVEIRDGRSERTGSREVFLGRVDQELRRMAEELGIAPEGGDSGAEWTQESSESSMEDSGGSLESSIFENAEEMEIALRRAMMENRTLKMHLTRLYGSLAQVIRIIYESNELSRIG